MFKKKIIFALLVIILLILMTIFVIDKAANSPKYQTKINQIILNKFFLLPDFIKSSVMIISGRKSFSNLFNDYNVKFIPETQYINIKFDRKKINYKKKIEILFMLMFIRKILL